MKLRIALLSLLTIVCLVLAVSPAMASTVYDNGPYNGTNDAWTINFGFAVSDSFNVAGNSSITDLHIVYWDASSTDLLTSVDMQLGSSSFGGPTQTLSGATNQFLSTNQFGYFLYAAWFTFPDKGWSGDGFVTLSNACSTSGCSVSNPIYWDENSGPSTAYENTIGSIPSEAFTVTGLCGCCGIAGGKGPNCSMTPEPSTITLLFGSGIVGLAGALRRKLF
jgi:hypothetical protein